MAEPRWTPETEKAMQAAYDEHTTNTDHYPGGGAGWRCMGCVHGRAEDDAFAGENAGLHACCRGHPA